MSVPKVTTPLKLLHLIPKLGNVLIGITIICYGTGFAITNLYLGSMGIVTFDILRARYILAGLMFIFFLGAIVFLVAGLLRTIRKNLNKSRIVVILKELWFSLLSFGLLQIVIQTVRLFAGSMEKQDYFIPQPKQPDIPWSDWFLKAPLSALRNTTILLGIVLVLSILVITIFIIINPKDKDGIKSPRKQILSDAYKKIKESKGKVFGSLIGAVLLIYLLILSESLLSFYLNGRVSSTSTTISTLPDGWSQLFNGIVIVYTFVALYLTLIALYPPSTTLEEDTIQPKSYSWIYIVAISISIIVPIYTSRVYPTLPQQIGGGQLLKVQVVMSDNVIEPLFEDIDMETYLIDRTSNTSFFFIQNTAGSVYKIIEIQNDSIQNITYAHSP
jgi:hypothetical protein